MADSCTETARATITEVDNRDGTVVVAIAGEIDMTCDNAVRAVLSAQLDRQPAGLVVDLTAVDFFGSTGIQLVVEASARAERLGVALAVATDRRTVLRPLEITLVNEMVDIHPTVRDALAALPVEDVPTPRHALQQ
ncbi:STAS domain-containing protein [Saccharothrix hoggarensis]|uniref:Anti-sigma factor antagonist n=1 Tax=Saccharothrix hoggarensis TaxID=913853 RepID=A0ABW3QI95_9PSEU